jgi:tetratricopeptide (TPR) repeat protein
VLFAQLEDRETQALMHVRLATIHERLGDFGQAGTAWQGARALCRRVGDLRGEARALEGMARAARHQSTPGAATPLYEEALRHAIRIGDRELELSVRNSLGIIHWERGAYADALAHYEVALQLCRDLEDRVHEGLVLNSLGATLLRLNRLEEARTALEDGVRTNGTTGQRKLEAQSLATLADVCLAIGRTAEARRHVEASLAARREIGDRRGEGWMLAQLARVLDAAGARDEAAAARASARRIAEETTDAALSDTLMRAVHAGVAQLPLKESHAPLHH